MPEKDRKSGKTVPGFTPELGDRIKRVISEIGTQKQAAQLVGVRPETLAAWQKGEQKAPFLDLVTLCTAAGLPITWLATGEGLRDSSTAMSQSSAGTQPEHAGMVQRMDSAALSDKSMILLPYLNVEASAGTGMVVEDEDVGELIAFDAAWLRARHITPQAARVVTARGDSMEPTIRNGDMLIVDTAIEMAVDSGVYVLAYNGLLLVKRLFLLRNGNLLISSDNKIAGRDEEIAAHEVDELRIAGRVMWYGRGM